MPEEKTFSFLDRFFRVITAKKAFFIIAFVGIVVFFNALFGGFVLDDQGLILYDKDLQHFRPIYFFQPNTYNASGLYRPLAILYFAALRQFVGTAPFLYHLFPIVLHIVSAFLVFLLFKKLISSKLSLLLSLIFLVHPMQVESVTYVSGTIGIVCFLFGMWALLLATEKIMTYRKAFFIGLFILISCLSKESGVQFIALIFLYRILFYKKAELKLWISTLLSSGIYLVLRFVIGDAHFSNPKNILIQQVSTSVRYSTIPAVLLYYLRTFIFPVDLLIIQNWAILHRDVFNFFFPLAIELTLIFVLLLVVLLFYKSRSTLLKTYIFFLLWLIGGMSLYLQFFPLDLTVSDRWFYFPMVGVLGIIGVFTQEIIQRSRAAKTWVALILMSSILLLSFRTFIRNFDWSDGMTLYKHDNTAHPSTALENAIGYEYVVRGDLNGAMQHFKTASALSPNVTSSENLANISMYHGDLKTAKVYFTEVLNTPDGSLRVQRDSHLEAAVGLGLISLLQDPPERAKALILTEIQHYPNAGNLFIELASVESILGDWDAALTAVQEVQKLSPNGTTSILYNKILNHQQVRLDARQHLH